MSLRGDIILLGSNLFGRFPKTKTMRKRKLRKEKTEAEIAREQKIEAGHSASE